MSDLIRAVVRGDFDEVEGLVANGADMNALDQYGNIPLHLAASYGHNAIAEFLVRKGANVNAVNLHGSTPLHCATWPVYTAIVEFLVAKGRVQRMSAAEVK